MVLKFRQAMDFCTSATRWRAEQLHNTCHIHWRSLSEHHKLWNCFMCCGTNASVWALRNLTASSNNIHAAAILSTYAMTSHCTSVRSCHLTDAKALRNTYVGKVLPAHVMKGNGKLEVQLLLFVTSVPNGMCSDVLLLWLTNEQYNASVAFRLKNRHDKCQVGVHFVLEKGFDSRPGNKFCCLHKCLIDYGGHSVSCSASTGCRAAWAWRWPLTDVKNKLGYIYLPFPNFTVCTARMHI